MTVGTITDALDEIYLGIANYIEENVELLESGNAYFLQGTFPDGRSVMIEYDLGVTVVRKPSVLITLNPSLDDKLRVGCMLRDVWSGEPSPVVFVVHPYRSWPGLQGLRRIVEFVPTANEPDDKERLLGLNHAIASYVLAELKSSSFSPGLHPILSESTPGL